LVTVPSQVTEVGCTVQVVEPVQLMVVYQLAQYWLAVQLLSQLGAGTPTPAGGVTPGALERLAEGPAGADAASAAESMNTAARAAHNRSIFM
jgi:hypothetical protein